MPPLAAPVWRGFNRVKGRTITPTPPASPERLATRPQRLACMAGVVAGRPNRARGGQTSPVEGEGFNENSEVIELSVRARLNRVATEAGHFCYLSFCDHCIKQLDQLLFIPAFQ